MIDTRMDYEFHRLCQSCWDALDIQDSGGRHISEHITDLKNRVKDIEEDNARMEEALVLISGTAGEGDIVDMAEKGLGRKA